MCLGTYSLDIVGTLVLSCTVVCAPFFVVVVEKWQVCI